MSLGPAEILVILVIALLVFGPKRLPEVGRQVGGALREFRKIQDTVSGEIRSAIDEVDPRRALQDSTPPSLPPKEAPGPVDATTVDDVAPAARAIEDDADDLSGSSGSFS